MLGGGDKFVFVENRGAGIRRIVESNGAIRGTLSHWNRIWNAVLPQGVEGERPLILDAGCGEHAWRSTDYTVARCDNWQGYRDRDRGEIDPDIRLFNLNKNWPYKDDEFMGVLAVDVIEHMENIYHFLREAMRISKRFVIVSTPNTESEFSRILFRRHGYLWGFIPEEVQYSHHLSPVFEWQMRVVERRSGWRLDKIAYANAPYRVPRSFGNMQGLQNIEPSRKGRIFRFVRPGG